MTAKNYVDAPTLAKEILTHDDFVICGHISPDGDCIGSQLALWHALRAAGKKATCLIAQDGSIDSDLKFLPGVDHMVAVGDYKGTPGACIAVDVSDSGRLGDEVAPLFESAPVTFIIDHHEEGEPRATFTYSDPGAASASMLVWDVLENLGVELTADMATCGYTGLLTDTGRFQFQNTDARAFRFAMKMVDAGANPSVVARELFQNVRLESLELEVVMLEHMYIGAGGRYAISYLMRDDFKRLDAVKMDADPLINTLRSIKGVEVACMLRETEEGVRGSLRAKNDINVEVIARGFGGGGHKAAAGFSMGLPIEAALVEVKKILEAQFLSRPPLV